MRWATQAAGWQTALWRRCSSGKRRGERPASLRAAPLSSHPPEQNGPRITPRVYCVATPTAHSGASLWLSCVEHAPPFTRSVKCHCRATTTPLRPPVVDTAVADRLCHNFTRPAPAPPPKTSRRSGAFTGSVKHRHGVAERDLATANRLADWDGPQLHSHFRIFRGDERTVGPHRC